MAMPDLKNLVRDSASTDAKPSMLASLRPDFMLQHHANAWEVATEGLSEPTWVPQLSPRPILVGANGIRTTRPGEAKDMAYRTALAEDERQGVQTIDKNDPRARVEGDSASALGEGTYVRSIFVVDPKTRGEGLRHIEAWDVPQETPSGIRQSFAYDRAAYNRWRVSLVVRGVINAPLAGVKSALLRKHDIRVLKAEVDDLPEQVRVRRTEEQEVIRDAVKGAKTPSAKKPRAVK
jgi:hypothetical protein